MKSKINTREEEIIQFQKIELDRDLIIRQST